MSFGEFMFLAGFTQKTTKEDLNIKRDRGIISWLLCRNVLEDTRGHHAEAGHKTLPSGASWPHPKAAWPTTMGNTYKLLESSSTASRMHLHRTSSWFDPRARIQHPRL
jgi:hypothetical protein